MTAASVLLLLFLFVASCRASGHFDLKLVRYQNVHGHDSRKDYCDSIGGGKSSLCDFFFTIGYNNKLGADGQTYPTYTTPVYWDKDTVEFQHFLIKKGFTSWQGRLNFDIHVTDKDVWTPDDHVDRITQSVHTAADNQERSFTLRGHYHGHNTQFVILLKVWCDAHWYGSACTTYCLEDSYYTCNVYGGKQCRPLWRDVSKNCREPDQCARNPCQNGGFCTQTSPTTRTCQCQTQFKGVSCETRKTPCEMDNKCVNGGVCVNVDAVTSKCNCQPGWIGVHCETDKNECEDTPCKNGATCVNNQPGYHCHCSSGFIGYNCTENIDECKVNATTGSNATTSSLCQNGGICKDTHGGFECLCHTGFNGTRCENDIDECLLNNETCKNDGNCTNTFGGFNCSCTEGYYGRRCEHDVNECANEDPVCKNNGTCSNTAGSFECACPPQFQGPTCEDDKNECQIDSKFCQNGGECVNTVGSAYCRCPHTFEGPSCEKDIDECRRFAPCQNGGVCINQNGTIEGYTCNCTGTGFRGLNCTVDIDECMEQNIDETCNQPQGFCDNKPGSYMCQCRLPYAGKQCQLCNSSAENGNLCAGVKPAEIFITPAPPRPPPIAAWLVPVICIIILMIIVGVLIFLGFRRKDVLQRIPSSVRQIRQRFSTFKGRTAVRMNKRRDEVDVQFGNPVYDGEGENGMSTLGTGSEFNNDVYMSPSESSRNYSTEDGFDNDAYDTEDGSIYPNSRAPTHSSAYPNSRAPTLSSAYPNSRTPTLSSTSPSEPQKPYLSMKRGEEPYYTDMDLSQPRPRPRSSSVVSDSSIQLSPPPRHPRSASSVPEESQRSAPHAPGALVLNNGYEDDEDPYAYAELPGQEEHRYTTLERNSQDIENRQMANMFDDEDFPPAPPLPPRNPDDGTEETENDNVFPDSEA